MSGIAHLSFKGGGLVLPVHTPYERELLVEHIEASTKRHGRSRLELNRRRWVIRTNEGVRAVCASCSQWPDEFTYPSGSTGRLSVVSAQAMPCTDVRCELAEAGVHG